MSSYVVSDNHINAIVTSLFDHDISRGDTITIYSNHVEKFEVTRDQAAQIILNENTRACDARYAVNGQAASGQFETIKYQRVQVSVLQAMKLIECVENQCCDNRTFFATQAAAILNYANRRLFQKLPGYNQVEWSIE